MRGDGEAGFALVEAIAALALSAIAAAALISTLGSSRSRTLEVEVRGEALRQAQYLLADAVSAPDLLQVARQGSLPDKSLSWTIRFGEEQEERPGLIEVEAIVAWTAAGRKGVTRLEAYRIAPAP
jgi:type II secretory pathway pseudopilin PulG